MKLQKLVFIVSASIIIILLILLVLSNCKDNNLLIGVLSSTIVVGAVAFVQYLHEKNRVIFITYKISKQLFVKLLGINKLLSENNTVANLQAITQLTKEATECGATLDINEYSPFCKSGKILYIITRLYSIYNIELRNFEYITNNYLIHTYEIAVKNRVTEINQNNEIIIVRQSLSHLMEIINYNMRLLDKHTNSDRWAKIHNQWMNQNQTVNKTKNHNKMAKNQTTNIERKSKRSFRISIVAIGVSVIAIGVSSFKITPFQVGHEAYIGFIVSLIGVLVTFAVAYQIYNAIELKESVKEFKSIKEELEVYKSEFAIFKSNSEATVYSLMGELHSSKHQTPYAILAALKGLLPLLSLMEHDDKDILSDIDVLFSNVKDYKDRLSLDQFESPNGSDRTEAVEKFKKDIENIKIQLQQHKFYTQIQERLEEVINLINQRIEECKKPFNSNK